MVNPEGFCYIILFFLVIYVTVKLIKRETQHRREHQDQWDMRDIVTFDLLARDDIWEDDDNGE